MLPLCSFLSVHCFRGCRWESNLQGRFAVNYRSCYCHCRGTSDCCFFTLYRLERAVAGPSVLRLLLAKRECRSATAPVCCLRLLISCGPVSSFEGVVSTLSRSRHKNVQQMREPLVSIIYPCAGILVYGSVRYLPTKYSTLCSSSR